MEKILGIGRSPGPAIAGWPQRLAEIYLSNNLVNEPTPAYIRVVRT